jgi:hypothetical protein
MGKNVKLLVLLGGVAAVVASVAFAMTGDQETPAVAPHKKVCLVVNAGNTETLNLEDLKDGESRTIKSDEGEVVVTRKGESIEVVSVGKDGTRRMILDTAAMGVGEEHALVGHGCERTHRVVIRTDEKGENVETTLLPSDESGDRRVVIKKLCLGGEGSETVEVGTDVTTHACNVDDAEAATTYRCKDDEALVTLPKTAQPQVVPSCPLCGKAMDKMTVHKIVVQTTINK